MDILEDISGNRVNYGINEIGGTRRDINQEQIDRMNKYMDVTMERLENYIGICLKKDTNN